MKLCPGSEPQCPRSRFLKCSGQQGLAQQRIVAQVNHSGAEVIAGSPVRIDIAQLIGRERLVCGTMRGLGLGNG